jgi:hypothetical protein
MQQTFVSIYVTDLYSRDCEVKEHLTDYLAQGWLIKEFKSLDGSGGGETTASGGWIIVLLEK